MQASQMRSYTNHFSFTFSQYFLCTPTSSPTYPITIGTKTGTAFVWKRGRPAWGREREFAECRGPPSSTPASPPWAWCQRMGGHLEPGTISLHQEGWGWIYRHLQRKLPILHPALPGCLWDGCELRRRTATEYAARQQFLRFGNLIRYRKCWSDWHNNHTVT